MPERQELTRSDAVRNSERIVEAARAVFARSGLDASLDDVAREAGVGVATVYRRFADKDQLIDALFESRIAAVVALAEEGLADPEPWPGLCGFVLGTAAEWATDRGLMHLFLSDHGRAHTRRARALLAPVVTRVFERAAAAGVLRPEMAASDLPMIQLLLAGVIDRTRDLRPDLWRRYAALILDGARADHVPRVPLGEQPLAFDQIDGVMHATLPVRRLQG